MVMNCHTKNAQSIAINLPKLWWWTVTLRMRKQLLLLWPNYGDELPHSECAINCYYFDQIKVMNCDIQNAQSIVITLTKLWWTVTPRMRNQLLLLWPNYGAELSHPECAINCYYFDQIMELNCHTQNAQSIVITLTKLVVMNWHTQNAQPIVVTLTKLVVTNCHTQNVLLPIVITLTKLVVTNCHTQNAQTIVITLTKLVVINCHTQNVQTIVITLTKLWWWTVKLRMRNQLLLLWPN